LIDWSCENAGQRFFVKKSSLTGGRTGIRISYNGLTNDFEIPFSDRASVENAITVTAVCLALETPDEVISRGLQDCLSSYEDGV